MQPITSYSTDNYIRLILQGPPGSGKTTTACQFPGAYVADLDINLGGALRWLRENNKPLPVGYDVIDRLDDGTPTPPAQRYQRLTTCLKAAVAEPSVQTIVIDGATKLSEIFQDEVLRQQNKSKMDIQMWGFYFTLWKQFISALTAQRKHLVLICHEKVEKDEVDAALRYFLMIPGQFGNIAGALFTDVWRAEVQVRPSGMTNNYQYVLRTMPDHRFQLKNSLGLPPTFQFDWPTIEAKLKGGAA